MSSKLESFCDCYLKFIQLAICLHIRKQSRDEMLEWRWQNIKERLTQAPPRQVTQHGKPERLPGNGAGARATPWHCFPKCVPISCTHCRICGSKEKTTEVENWKVEKNPLRQRFKVNFKECLGGECLLEFDKGREYNRRLLF